MAGDITTKINGYDNEDFLNAKEVEVRIINHWNRNECFGLTLGKKTLWFERKEFERAVQNACNHGY